MATRAICSVDGSSRSRCSALRMPFGSISCCHPCVSPTAHAPCPLLAREELLGMPLPIKPALTKAQAARPGEDVFQEAHNKLKRELMQRGWLKDNGDVLSPNNLTW